MNKKTIHNTLLLFFSIISLIVATHSAEARCVYDGSQFHSEGGESTTVLSPVYRLYNTRTDVHLYVNGTHDANYVLGKWPEFEFTDGVPAFCTSQTADDTTPIYRLYNTRTGVHLYTRGEYERDYILHKWSDFEFTDGMPAFYAHTTNDTGPSLHQNLGPSISIGLYAYTREELEDHSFRIISDEQYTIKNASGTVLATIDADTQTRVKYLNDSEHTFRIYNSVTPEITVTDELYFDIADGDGVFEIKKPDMDYTTYRGKIKLRYSNNNSVKRIWVINKLPLEQYVWGMGEITGTGPMDYNRVMTTSYRTYGYWKILYSTKYAIEGFDVNATPGNQLYRGYDWEKQYPRIRRAAEDTRGRIITHDGDVAITPYSSWTDGRTRNPDEVGWSASFFPHCTSVDDPYGDYNGDYWNNSQHMSTTELMAAGNHMVGLSAHGALTLAHDKNWSWKKILNYYFHNIAITSIY